jgi:hypothetical protein
MYIDKILQMKNRSAIILLIHFKTNYFHSYPSQFMSNYFHYFSMKGLMIQTYHEIVMVVRLFSPLPVPALMFSP